jgi:uracil-DNA glycosylase
MSVKIEPSWLNILQEYFQTAGFQELTRFVKLEYQTQTVYPLPQNIFRAFWLTPFDAVKVVILGQDPYHGPGQAQGLAFSVPSGMPLPPSLKNIYKEIQNETGIVKDFADGNLESWAAQGVFLLNSVLTVRRGQAGSHQKKGWEEFSDTVISKLSQQKEGLVFLLWGNFARSKKSLIDTNRHLVLEAAHPSPLSAQNGFFGCNHFLLTNQYLQQKGKSEILW